MTALGFALIAIGCDPPSDEAETSETGDTDEGDSETGDDGAFELESASLDATGQVVTLHFSQPVAPVDEVEPSDFRISYAAATYLCGDAGCDPETSYWDPNFYADAYLSYQYGSAGTFEVDTIASGAQPNEVSLHFGTPLREYLCESIENYGEGYDFLFVHYAMGDIPLDSADGQSLAEIGPQFVHQATPVFTAPGEFPNMPTRIPIPCSL